MKKNTFFILAVLAFIGILVVVEPLLLIWSLNTLFGLGIEYTLESWVAALLLSVIVSVTRTPSD